MLGTGVGLNPMVPGRARQMTSHVMVNNSTAYVLDCGLGVTNQFAMTGIPFTAVRSIFITHHHPGHNIEYAPPSPRVGARPAQLGARIRSTSAQADDRGFSACL
jgi:ribonuclease BN (tRNA processing enzyme)